MKNKITRAVVVGGSGFLGSHVADALTRHGFDVTIFDKRPSRFLQETQKMVLGDVLDLPAVQRAVKGCDYIFHFAGLADLDEAAMKPLDTVKDNIMGTATLLEAAAKEKVKRFIYASTVYVYSTLGSFYRCSKQASELYVEEYQRRQHLDYTILRFGTLYGPRADQHNSIWRYLRQALMEKKLAIQGTGDEIREYIHVRDAAELTVDILSDKFANQHVIITGHHPMKAVEMFKMIREILNNKVKIKFDKSRFHPAHYNITPYSFTPKIGSKLVRNPYVDFGQGLLECLNEIYRDLQKPSVTTSTVKLRSRSRRR